MEPGLLGPKLLVLITEVSLIERVLKDRFHCIAKFSKWTLVLLLKENSKERDYTGWRAVRLLFYASD